MRKILILLLLTVLFSCEKNADCTTCSTIYKNAEGRVYMGNRALLCDFTDEQIKEYINRNTSPTSKTNCIK